MSSLHGACTLSDIIFAMLITTGAYDCLEFFYLKCWLVSAWQYLTSEYLPLFASSTSSSPRLGADECRPMIFKVGGICVIASCSPLLTESKNYLALLCPFQRTLVC